MKRSEKGSWEKHEKMLDDLEARLKDSHPSDRIIRDFEYDRGEGKRGQIDLMRITPYKTWIPYEVKSMGAYRKAKEQFRRFYRAFPEQNIKGIYISPYEAIRIR